MSTKKDLTKDYSYRYEYRYYLRYLVARSDIRSRGDVPRLIWKIQSGCILLIRFTSAI